MSEDLHVGLVKGILNGIDVDRLSLETAVGKAETKGKTLMKLFSAENTYPEFDNPEKFWMSIIDLSEQIGHAQYMVLEIENKRKQLMESLEEKKTNPTAQPSVVVNPPMVAPPAGVWGYVGARRYASSQEKMQKMAIQAMERSATPQIATEHSVIDILDFGRQLTPEFNRVYNYFQQCLDHLSIFDDDNTKIVFHGELRTHLLKLTTIIRSFCRTVSEYRKSVLDEIKMQLAKSLTEVATAQAIGGGKMSLSDFYRMAREGMEPQDAGR